MTIFYCEYSILPEHSTREACMTLFGGMSELDDLKELGNVKLLGRWACVGEAKGYCIAKAENVKDMQKWLNGWVTMADIKVVPCLDDNEQRELILKGEPPYKVSYEKVGDAAKEKESLYFVKYKFREGNRQQGFELFANLSEEDDQKDSGNCTSYGRWHVPSQGCGFAIASSPSALDIYKWAYNWDSLCDVEVVAVTRDEETREIIKSGLGFEEKHKNLMEKLNNMLNPKKNCFF